MGPPYTMPQYYEQPSTHISIIFYYKWCLSKILTVKLFGQDRFVLSCLGCVERFGNPFTLRWFYSLNEWAPSYRLIKFIFGILQCFRVNCCRIFNIINVKMFSINFPQRIFTVLVPLTTTSGGGAAAMQPAMFQKMLSFDEIKC